MEEEFRDAVCARVASLLQTLQPSSRAELACPSAPRVVRTPVVIYAREPSGNAWEFFALGAALGVLTSVLVCFPEQDSTRSEPRCLARTHAESELERRTEDERGGGATARAAG